MSGTVPDDAPIPAAEYALGSLDLGEMRGVEARAAADPAFAAEIAWWEDRLSGLANLVPPVEPPASLWARLALVTGARAERPGVWSRPGIWRGTTAAALAVAAGFAALLLLPRAVIEPQRYVAALAPTASPASFVVQALQGGRIVLTPLGTQQAASGRDLQLWALPKDATRPVSLGVITPDKRQFDGVVASQPQTQLLISSEPAGGSPTGLPTGPVVFGGTLTPAN